MPLIPCAKSLHDPLGSPFVWGDVLVIAQVVFLGFASVVATCQGTVSMERSYCNFHLIFS